MVVSIKKFVGSMVLRKSTNANIVRLVLMLGH